MAAQLAGGVEGLVLHELVLEVHWRHLRVLGASDLVDRGAVEALVRVRHRVQILEADALPIIEL